MTSDLLASLAGDRPPDAGHDMKGMGGKWAAHAVLAAPWTVAAQAELKVSTLSINGMVCQA